MWVRAVLGLAGTSLRIAGTRSAESDIARIADAWASRNAWKIETVTTVADGVLVRAAGPLPEPETASLTAAVKDAGLVGTAVSVELIPTRTVELTPGG
ncbi:MAG: hypothetical protein ABIP03_01270 [Aquihabitans sp.]